MDKMMSFQFQQKSTSGGVNQCGRRFSRFFSPRLLLAALTLLTTLYIGPEEVDAQLVNWRDLISAEVLPPDELIQFGEDSLQFGELWLPDTANRKTAVVLIHGGCWLSDYPGVELMHPMANRLREEGFIVWNLEDRRLGHEGGGYPGTFLDVAEGADLLPSLLEERALQVARILVSGHSAGGHLATWLASRNNIPMESVLRREHPMQPDGLISLAGINDLEEYARYGSSSCGEKSVERLVDVVERGSDAYRDTSPAELLPLGIPYIEITAAFDAPVPPFFGRAFTEKARAAGDDVTLILQPEAGHFEMVTPWSSEWVDVLEKFIQLSEK